jgi:hypothetical protein
MPHSIFAKLQPVSQWIVPDPAHRARRLRVDPVLFLPYAARVQSLGFDGLEAVRNLRPSLSSWLRFTGRSMGCDPEMVGSTLTDTMSIGACKCGGCPEPRLLEALT